MNPSIENYIDSHDADLLERLRSFVAIESISTDPDKKGEMGEACGFLKARLEGAGIEARIIETDRHPAVLADSGPSDGPTLLIYGHYDVQPAGDLSLWGSPPFEPTLREGALYGRGTADDKGQVLCQLAAVEAWKKTAGSLPCRVKFLIEGEEEIGSPSLEALVRRHKEDLACDLIVLSDTGKISAAVPAITYGTMGLVYKDIKVYGPKQNIHSGSHGGTVANPGNVVAALVAAMKDEDRKVAIPGFYDDVIEASEEERAALKALPFDEKEYLAHLGSPAPDGEAGYTTLERRWVRPKLDVNGLYGGFGGEGAMTIVPSMCGAKVSMRLVPDQDPEKISEQFDAFVRGLCPSTVRLEIDTHGVVRPYLTPLDLPALKAAAAALKEAYGAEPAMIREGGTIPIMALFREELGAESVLMGFADPNCNMHGPNEFFHVSDLVRGTKAAANFLHELARMTAED